MTTRLTILLLALCACGPVSPSKDAGSGGGAGGGSGSGGSGGDAGTPFVPSADVFKSGSRLKARVLVGDDGVVSNLGWHDAQLNNDCYFWPSADGEYRCVPALAPYAVDSIFLDPSCSEPALRLGGCLPAKAPTEAVRYETTVCPARWHVFAVEQEVPTSTVFFKNGLACTTVTVTAGEKVYKLGAEYPATRFVKAARTLGTGTGIGVNTLTAEDGASSAFGLRDIAGGFDCLTGWAGDGVARCLPQDALYYGNSFSDSSCVNRAWLNFSLGCGTPTFLRRNLPGPGCETAAAFSRPGNLVTTYYSGASCSPVDTNATYSAWAEGPAVAPGSFAAATPGAPTGNRLKRGLVSWPGSAKQWGNWFDSQFNDDCLFQQTADDSWRCTVGAFGTNVTAWYSDAACTYRVAIGQGSACVPRYARSYEGCPTRVHSYNVGLEHTGTVYQKAGTSCVAITRDPALKYFLVGAEVPTTSMALATEQLR